MITRIKEFSEKMDKVGKEDIDINNDGKVDKSDFFLLGRRRKIKKAIKDKKTNENTESASNYNMAMNIFDMANTITFLMDEGFITDDFDFAEGVDLPTINKEMSDNDMGSFPDLNRFIAYLEKFKKLLSVYSTFHENANINENSEEYKRKFHDWQKWYDDKIEPAKSTIKMNLEKIWEITQKLDVDLTANKHFTTDILKINSDLKEIRESYPNL